MSRILFLDDCPTRRARFRAKFPEAVMVETAPECIDQLRDHGPWDAVFLDHDLGGMTYVDWRADGTGSEVVRWILRNRPFIGQVIVHSLNTPAANRMTSHLSRAGYDAEYVDFLRLAETILS